jgi:hypothetical protein
MHRTSELDFLKIELDLDFVELNNIQSRVNFIEAQPAESIVMDRTIVALPAWLEVLDEEDAQFLRRFLLSSGSLKAMAEEYGVSYPTVRGRLDRLIAKVRAAEDPKVVDPFERKLRILVADAKVSAALAKDLLDAHRDSLKERKIK